jgi:hypothetical protein
MATILVAGVGAFFGTQATAAGAAGAAGAIAAATAAASIGAAYIDTKYVYPALFGKDSPRNPNSPGLGIDTMTGNDGDPGHRSWGQFAMVGGHVLWFENLEQAENRTGSKKGGGATITRRVADVGVGLTRNRIEAVESIFADQKVLWRRESNNVVWIDHRATIALNGPGTQVAITPTADTQDLGQIFHVGNIVTLRNATGGTHNGYYRVHFVWPKGSAAAPFGYLELTPIENVAPSAGVAGTAVSPLEIRRRDLCLAYVGAVMPGPDQHPLIVFPGPDLSPGAVTNGYLVNGHDLRFDSAGSAHSSQWVSAVGRTFRAIRPTGATGALLNWAGLWRCRRVTLSPGTGTAQNQARVRAEFVSLEYPPNSPYELFRPDHWGVNGSRLRLEVEGDEGFLEPSPGQEIVFYLGTEDEGPDPDLVAIYGADNVHGFRGLARFTIRNLNLTNTGDRVPQLSAAVRVSGNHSTHDFVRDLMAEALGPGTSLDLSRLPSQRMLGYTRRGQQQTTTTMQPVAIAYGIESQEQGRTWSFFDGASATLHRLREDELGAFVGSQPSLSRFSHRRIQDRDLPRRLSVYYRDPTNDFTRTQKMSRVATPGDLAFEDVSVDIDPVVLYPWDAQRLVDRIHQEALAGRDQGTITLPPSRCDILNNDRVTFTALNWNDEEAAIDDGAIAHQTQIGEVEPRSVSIEIVIVGHGNCRVVDDGDGNLDGYPGDLFTLSNDVDYDTGAIALELGVEYERGLSTSSGTTTTLNDSGGGWLSGELVDKIVVFTTAGYVDVVERSVVTANTSNQVTFSPATSIAYGAGAHYMLIDQAPIEEGLVRYEFPNPWVMRVQRVTRHRNRTINLDLVAVRESFPIVGSPVQQNELNYQPSIRPAFLASHVLDIPAIVPATMLRAGVFYAACAKPGSVWRGAAVYTSQDDISYSLRALIHEQTVMGSLMGFGAEIYRGEVTEDGTATTMVDDTASWATDELADLRVELLDEDETTVVAVLSVTSNTADEITFDPEMPVAVQEGQKFRIMGPMQVADASPAVVDGLSRLVVQLDYGTLTGATFAEIAQDNGRNWALIGNEVVQFLAVEHDAINNTWVISGVVRGRRDTADQIAEHEAGDRFVLLDNLGEAVTGVATGFFDEFDGPGIQGRTLWWKIVPNGGNVDDVTGVQLAVHGANVRPFAPAAVVQGSLADWGYDAVLASQSYDATAWLSDDVVVRWFPRSRALAPEFGAGGANWQAGIDPTERYLVEVLLGDVVVDSDIVGGTATGSPLVHRTYRYTLAQQTAAGFASADEATIRVRQIGHGGEGGLGRHASIGWTVP